MDILEGFVELLVNRRPLPLEGGIAGIDSAAEGSSFPAGTPVVLQEGARRAGPPALKRRRRPGVRGRSAEKADRLEECHVKVGARGIETAALTVHPAGESPKARIPFETLIKKVELLEGAVEPAPGPAGGLRTSSHGFRLFPSLPRLALFPLKAPGFRPGEAFWRP